MVRLLGLKRCREYRLSVVSLWNIGGRADVCYFGAMLLVHDLPKFVDGDLRWCKTGGTK